jgi:hypothetical protein
MGMHRKLGREHRRHPVGMRAGAPAVTTPKSKTAKITA